MDVNDMDKERLETLLMNLVDELLSEEEFNNFLRNEMGFTDEDIVKYSPYHREKFEN
jgi:hypothetical protein